MAKKRKAIVEHQEDKPEPPTRGDVGGRVERYTEAIKRGERIFEMDKSESTKRACELLRRWVDENVPDFDKPQKSAIDAASRLYDLRDETKRLLEMIAEDGADDQPAVATRPIDVFREIIAELSRIFDRQDEQRDDENV